MIVFFVVVFFFAIKNTKYTIYVFDTSQFGNRDVFSPFQGWWNTSLFLEQLVFRKDEWNSPLCWNSIGCSELSEGLGKPIKISNVCFEMPRKVVNHWCFCRMVQLSKVLLILQTGWKVPFFKTKKYPLFACTSDLFVEFARNFCSNGDYFCNSLSTATDVHCCLQEILPQAKTTNKKRSIPMFFLQALKMMMLKKFFFQFIFGVFFQSLHPNGCLEARISQAKLFLGGTVALKQITLTFLGIQPPFF